MGDDHLSSIQHPTTSKLHYPLSSRSSLFSLVNTGTGTYCTGSIALCILLRVVAQFDPMHRRRQTVTHYGARDWLTGMGARCPTQRLLPAPITAHSTSSDCGKVIRGPSPDMEWLPRNSEFLSQSCRFLRDTSTKIRSTLAHHVLSMKATCFQTCSSTFQWF